MNDNNNNYGTNGTVDKWNDKTSITIWNNKSKEQQNIDDNLYKDVMMPIERVISKQQQQQQLTSTLSQQSNLQATTITPITGKYLLNQVHSYSP